MIKIWPIHKHQWRLINTSTYTWKHNITGKVTNKKYVFLLGCRCHRTKTKTLNNQIMSDASLEKYTIAKGWTT